ncbi:MAG: dTDP-4-dehydrorhamnose 3,5-epimerase [Clostridium beijerinckii]|jgi:dTDP-4-dehydrorhamnose 3,5-epimerase|nr:dTDP-4-dehydrorhamnose 3,5-epimerase [Clostridium beijerinckii]MCI1577484.1 dTDP-4-dehydrorhamnose 3,5-epimerase [Clostridium beijerinckii]MCI1583257.1 dTDP-4-dehydrorhamnose 3,5-epimerase [Clostridium beijerinckii]MCI1621157.1 dTDP-4-dehydrorhamnose 3,5-epimerase [Clostridium beijerinckii]
MELVETKLKGVYIIQPRVFKDERGWFMETYSKVKMPNLECDFVQDNHSYSKEKGVLRGIHFQNGEYAQAKLVRCIRGSVLDVAVDLRKGSPTYKEWVSIELSAENKKQLFIPKGFGHGYLTLTNNVEFIYKVDNYYNAEYDRSIRYCDPEIAIKWDIKNPILSEKDKKAPLLKESDCTFLYDK